MSAPSLNLDARKQAGPEPMDLPNKSMSLYLRPPYSAIYWITISQSATIFSLEQPSGSVYIPYPGYSTERTLTLSEDLM